MKLASFFVLSLGLHAAALIYPVSFYAPAGVQFIPVTILPIDEEAENSGAGKSASATPVARSGSKSNGSMRRTVQPEAQSNANSNPEPPVLPAEVAAKLSSNSPFASAIANSSQSNSAEAIFVPTGNHTPDYGMGAGGNGGTGTAIYGTDLGQGNGQGSAGNGSVRTQARYRDTPKPIYPETARREGHEGRVILRVLIDTQGKTKSVELNTSSGSQALDQAAAEAIKRWRFHPAQLGDTPVDSWVNVPIDFRLTETRN